MVRGPERDSRVQAALWAALDRSHLRDGPHPGVLWVSDESEAPPGPTQGIRRLDLTDIDLSRDRGEAAVEGTPPVPACVLAGVLERVDDPGSLLAWAYHRLRPGGLLALSVRDVRSAGPRKLRSLESARAGIAHLFPGETLQGLLFREGFEQPRLRRRGAGLVVTARRSALAPPPQRRQRLSVIVPAYNEIGTFETTMTRLLEKEIPGVEIETILVESNSTDGTHEKAVSYSEHPRVTLILEDRPRGKGHACRAGLEAAHGDFLLIQDADTEYDVDDYDALLEPLRAGEVGFVLGLRTSPGGAWGMRDFGQHGVVSRFMNVGHYLFLFLFNTVYGQHLKDPFTMYKVVRRDCLYGLSFECNRFDFDWELVGKLVRAGYTPREIPVSYHSRSFGEGKKITFIRDPLTWVKACFKYRFVNLYPDR